MVPFRAKIAIFEVDEEDDEDESIAGHESSDEI